MSSDSQSPATTPLVPVPVTPKFRHLALLHSVRRRQRSAFLVEAAVWAVATLVTFLFVSGLIAKGHPAVARSLIAGAAVASVALFYVFGLRRAQRALVDDLQTAHWLSGRMPGLKHDWVAAVELSQAMKSSPAFSTALADAFLSDFNDQLILVDTDGLVDERPLRRARWGLVAMLVCVAAAGYFSGSRWLEGIASLKAGPQKQAVASVREPITGDVTLNYRYPAYTNLEPRTVTGTSGEISAPAGTEVVFQTLSLIHI